MVDVSYLSLLVVVLVGMKTCTMLLLQPFRKLSV